MYVKVTNYWDRRAALHSQTVHKSGRNYSRSIRREALSKKEEWDKEGILGRWPGDVNFTKVIFGG